MLKSLWMVLALSGATGSVAHALERDVGLGVAVGGAFSTTKLAEHQLQRAGDSFSWGFFVDIPLLETFYISPAALIYELDLGNGKEPVTDVDLAFKFILPLSALRLGVGVLGGLTTAELKYQAHVGLLAHAGLFVLPSFEIFAQFQYKRLLRPVEDLDDLHGYIGGMFHL